MVSFAGTSMVLPNSTISCAARAGVANIAASSNTNKAIPGTRRGKGKFRGTGILLQRDTPGAGAQFRKKRVRWANFMRDIQSSARDIGNSHASVLPSGESRGACSRRWVMHIHAAQASALGNALAGAQDAETAMSLRRARELRDAAVRLKAASFEPIASLPADPDTAAQTVFMIAAWSGGGSAASQPGS